MAWYLNRALTTLRAEVNARWPRRDKASDGTIGDAAHRASVSDHNPDGDGSVDAWDMDVHGVDVELIKDRFEAHEAAGYWIHNDQIASRSNGWRRESYAYAGPGRNRHTQHVHFNSRQSHERSARPWGIAAAQPEEDDVAAVDVWKIKYREYVDEGGNSVRDPRTTADILYSTHAAAISAVRAAQEHTVLLRRIAGQPADQILAEIRAEGEKTRAALLAAVREQAPTLAAAVVERLGTEVTAAEIGEALAVELAGMLTAGEGGA